MQVPICEVQVQICEFSVQTELQSPPPKAHLAQSAQQLPSPPLRPRRIGRHHHIGFARPRHPPLRSPVRPIRKIIGHIILIRVTPMRRTRPALQRNRVKCTAILKTNVNRSPLGLPQIPPLCPHRRACPVSQVSCLMIKPAAGIPALGNLGHPLKLPVMPAQSILNRPPRRPAPQKIRTIQGKRSHFASPTL
jgi:hypothetical protein